MDIALLFGFVFLFVFLLAIFPVVYSNFIYNYNKLFNKIKISYSWLIIFGVMLIFFLVSLIFLLISLNSNQPMKFVVVDIVLNALSCFINLIYLVSIILMPKICNKNKITYEQMLDVDYDQKINQLFNSENEAENAKAELSKKNPKYYKEMLSAYEAILLKVSDINISLINKETDIVYFNEQYSHKWSIKLNKIQLLLTYKFCKFLKKN